MSEPQNVFDHWNKQQYMDALKAAWTLPQDYTYAALDNPQFSFRDLVFRACHQAVESALRSAANASQAKDWADSLLNKFPPPLALIKRNNNDTSKEFRQFRTQILQAHLEIVSAIFGDKGHWPTLTVSSDKIIEIAEKTRVEKGLVRDLIYTMIPEKEMTRKIPLPQPISTLTVNALLVNMAQNTGHVATLTMELLHSVKPDEKGELYINPKQAFTFREKVFREAEATARDLVKDTYQLWADGYDVRWHMERKDGGQINTLEGPSAGAAFTIGLAKLTTATL